MSSHIFTHAEEKDTKVVLLRLVAKWVDLSFFCNTFTNTYIDSLETVFNLESVEYYATSI